MLEDVQERLVYRTHIYIQTDIAGYRPAPGDLAYPDKLVMMEVGPPHWPRHPPPPTSRCFVLIEIGLCFLILTQNLRSG